MSASRIAIDDELALPKDPEANRQGELLEVVAIDGQAEGVLHGVGDGGAAGGRPIGGVEQHREVDVVG